MFYIKVVKNGILLLLLLITASCNSLQSDDTGNKEITLEWIRRGNDLYNTGEYEEALKYYDKAIKKSPDYANAWYNRGIALYCLGKYEEALKCYDKAIELDPNDTQAWQNKEKALKAIYNK